MPAQGRLVSIVSADFGLIRRAGDTAAKLHGRSTSGYKKSGPVCRYQPAKCARPNWAATCTGLLMAGTGPKMQWADSDHSRPIYPPKTADRSVARAQKVGSQGCFGAPIRLEPRRSRQVRQVPAEWNRWRPAKNYSCMWATAGGVVQGRAESRPTSAPRHAAPCAQERGGASTPR